VDDHPATREGLRVYLTGHEGCLIAGESATSAAAKRDLAGREPDALILDLCLPDGDGLDLLAALRAQGLRAPILVYSVHGEESLAARCLRAGANGYLTKSASLKELGRRLRAILRGEPGVSPGLEHRLLRGWMEGQTPSGVESLTNREWEVFERLAKGESTGQIAGELFISPKTVETHRTRLKEKLKLASVPELVSFAATWMARHDPG
jgi:DNA-binding NarL/FixJ family response regulator